METPIQELIEKWRGQMNDSPAYAEGIKSIYRMFIAEAEELKQKEKQFGFCCFEAGEVYGQLLEQAMDHCGKNFDEFYKQYEK